MFAVEGVLGCVLVSLHVIYWGWFRGWIAVDGEK